jgi:hypothetical protein
MLNNQRKLKFEIVIKNRIPRLKVQEKHEVRVRWAIRVLTVIGILISVFTFSAWYYALCVSVGLFILNQILEKMIFTYTIMIVQPMPNKWKSEAWSMMIVGKFNDRYVLAFGFNEKDVAIDFFDTILYWNNKKLTNNDNINISLVLEDKDNYSVHVYPNVASEFVLNAMDKTKEHSKYDKFGKEQTNLVMQIDICKVFPNGPQSAFNILKNFHKDIYICVYDTHNFRENHPETIKSIHPFDNRKILCKNIKVMNRSELNKHSDIIEFFHIPIY